MSRFSKVARPGLVIAAVAFIFIITFAVVSLLWRDSKPRQAFDVTGVLSDGHSLYSLSDNYGKTGSVLLFFDIEDVTAAALMEEVAAIAPEYTADILAVSISRQPIDEQVQMLTEQGIAFPHILFDPDGEAAETYNVRVAPVTYFIDKNGLVQQAFVGPISEKSLRKALAALD